MSEGHTGPYRSCVLSVSHKWPLAIGVSNTIFIPDMDQISGLGQKPDIRVPRTVYNIRPYEWLNIQSDIWQCSISIQTLLLISGRIPNIRYIHITSVSDPLHGKTDPVPDPTLNA